MKKINVNLVKPNYSYLVEELAGVISVEKNTVLSYIKDEGLETIDALKPFLIHGRTFRAFIEHRQTKNLRPLAFGQCYCFKCRAARYPHPDSIEIGEKGNTLQFKGACIECTQRMCRIMPLKSASDLKSFLKSQMINTGLTESVSTHPKRYKRKAFGMKEFNAENERMKHKYFDFEDEANGKDSKTIDKIRKGIIRFEQFTNFMSFKTFNSEQAKAFKAHLMNTPGAKGQKLSLSTISHVLPSLQVFLKWLAQQPGYAKKIKYEHIEYLNLKDNERNSLKTEKLKTYPSLEDIRKVLFTTPAATEIERRNKAIIAFLASTGVRDGALISFKLKHLDVARKLITHDPKEVKSKFGKFFYTVFFPVGDDIHEVVLEWARYLRETKGYDDDCPLFPKEGLEGIGSFGVRRGVLSKSHWAGAGRIREIVMSEFERAGVESHPPHRFRDTLSALGRSICGSNLDYQLAWSKNFGHANPQITFGTYGNFTSEQQIEEMAKLNARDTNVDTDVELEVAFNALNKYMAKKTRL